MILWGVFHGVIGSFKVDFFFWREVFVCGLSDWLDLVGWAVDI